MSDQIKTGLFIAAAILIATAGYIYFSPYQSCMRLARDHYAKDIEAGLYKGGEFDFSNVCLREIGGI